MLDINFIRDTIYSHVSESQRETLKKEFYWGEYTTYPAVRGIFHLDSGWYFWLNSDHSEPVFSGPISDEDIIAYLFNLEMGIAPEPYKISLEKANQYLSLPRYYSLKEIPGSPNVNKS